MNEVGTAPQRGLFIQEYVRLLKNKKQCVAVYLLSFFFSSSCVFSVYGEYDLSLILLGSIGTSIPLAILIGAALCALSILRSGEAKGSLGFSLKVFLASFAVIMLVWGIGAFLACYPGICTTDTEDILKMIWGLPFESGHFRYDTLNNHHPAFYVFLVSLPLGLGSFLGLSQSVAVGMVALFHMLTLAACCSLVQSKLWIITRSRVFCSLSFVFFVLNPLIMLYSVTIWKDVIFAAFFIVYVAELFSLISSGKDFFSSRIDISVLAVSTFFCLLLRSNAFVAMVPAFVVLIFAVKKAARQIALLFVSVTILTVIIVGPFYTALGVKPAHFSETLSIPLQQMARVAASGANAVSEEQHAYLDELLPFEKYSELYNGGVVNFIKFSSEFNDELLDEDKLRFFSNWIGVGINNPEAYLSAWFSQTRGFWDPTYVTWYFGNPGYDIDGSGTTERNLTGGMIDYRMLTGLFGVFYPVFAPIYNSAFLAWTVLFTFVAVLLRNRNKTCICMVPLILWWLSFLLAAPAGDFRYMFPVHLALPLVALVLLYDPPAQKSVLPATE